jgi:CDGSH-type Zn-finger protein
MRRVVKIANKPLEIKPQEKSVWICMCGLSKNQPYCDGSHKKVADEEDVILRSLAGLEPADDAAAAASGIHVVCLLIRPFLIPLLPHLDKTRRRPNRIW